MIKKIIENTIFVILLFVLAIAISPVLPFKNVPRTYTVVSGSMEPSIKTGSIVLTQPVDPTSVQVGDVVAFTSPSNSKDVILHRIVGIKSTEPLRFQTKGDNNNTADPWDLMDVGVLGKQIFTVPYLGHVAAFIRTPVGFVVLIVIPALLFIISQILNIKKYIKQEIDHQVKSKTIPTLLFFLSFSLASSLLFTTSILANFRSVVSVSQVTFSVKDFVAPPAPRLLSPPNNSLNNGQTLTQTWSSVTDDQPGIVRYEYESCHVNPGLGTCSNVRWSETFTTTSKTATNIANATFWWRVRAIDSSGNKSAWSDVWKLIVDNSSVLPPQDLHWNNPDISCGGYNNSFTATADWNDVSGATSYTYEIDYPPLSGGRAKWRTNVSTSQYTGTFHQAEGLHFYRVMATNGIGQTSAWSSTCSVIYDKTTPSSSLDADQPYTQNTHNFNIGYTATDVNLDHVKLCYSHNLGDYVCGYQQPSATGSFSFDSPSGDGLYNFYTIAYDLAGNVEAVKASELTVQVDTKAPTTNVDLQSVVPTHTLGQNLLTNGGFEEGMLDWNVDSNGGDHHIVSSDTVGNMFIIGNKDAPESNIVDSIFRTVTLPENLSSSLSFSFRNITQDIVDNDYFSVNITSTADTLLENIITTGGSETGGDSFINDSGWTSLAHSLIDYAGQTIKIWFTQTNSDDLFALKSWTYLDNISINTLDLRVGETFALDFNTHDTGSGILSSQSPTDLSIGDTVVIYQNTDIASNSESTQSASVIVQPKVVINKINSNNTIEIYNNTSENLNLSGYKINALDIGPTVINAYQPLVVNVGFSETYILNNGLNDVDTSPQIASGENWQRTPVGVGTWNKISTSLDFNLVSRSSVNKITLSVFNITNSPSYEIKYTNSVGPQGFAGTMTPTSIVDGKSDRDFYLGTCSSGGVCTPESVSIGSTISVTVDGITKYFNY